MHARVSDLAESSGRLRFRAHRYGLPQLRTASALCFQNISRLNTWPACASVNASRAALRLPAHDSRSGWFATPYLCDSYIRYSAPVYPGALPKLFPLTKHINFGSAPG